ncbi:MAG TPA: hypothetical protein VLE95_08325 [Chlamydiales bacterium]|nr:hypothetical protein [Chlamydiales bacterium]
MPSGIFSRFRLGKGGVTFGSKRKNLLGRHLNLLLNKPIIQVIMWIILSRKSAKIIPKIDEARITIQFDRKNSHHFVLFKQKKIRERADEGIGNRKR